MSIAQKLLLQTNQLKAQLIPHDTSIQSNPKKIGSVYWYTKCSCERSGNLIQNHWQLKRIEFGMSAKRGFKINKNSAKRGFKTNCFFGCSTTRNELK